MRNILKAGETGERCIVCSKQIHAGEDYLSEFCESTNYVVCCASCAEKFRAHPKQYIMLDYQE